MGTRHTRQTRQTRQDKRKRKEKERIRESQPKKDFADFPSHSPENLNCWSSLHCCHHQLN